MMKITKATEIKRTANWRILIYGKAGLGKTSLVKRLPGRTLVLDMDHSSKVLAGQTMVGMHGKGAERQAKLGKRYTAVQTIINERLKIITAQESHRRLAKEVLAGHLGTGEERKKNLGSYYQAVQDIVNKGVK